MLASFEELADQIKNAVEDVFLFVTACTVQDSKARIYFLKRFSWDFLQRAKARYDSALTASKVQLDTKDVSTLEFEQWLFGKLVCKNKIVTLLESASLCNPLKSIPVSDNQERELCQKTFIELFNNKKKNKVHEGDISVSFLQQCQKLLLTSTRSHLERMLQSYKNEVLWANMLLPTSPSGTISWTVCPGRSLGWHQHRSAKSQTSPRFRLASTSKA
jgi:hypothetical protein